MLSIVADDITSQMEKFRGAFKLWTKSTAFGNFYKLKRMKRRLWTDDGKQIPIENMTLGHLCNTIRYMGERLEEARSAGESQQIARIESYLGDLQAEQERRLPEIEKAQGLLSVLLKSAKKVI